MKPVRTFLQQNAIKLWLNLEKPVYNITKGKHARNLFLSSIDIPYVGSKVKILKETNTSTYIAKMNDDGSFDNSTFKILNATDMHLDEDYDLNDKTLQFFVNQIRDEKPDLVIFTGDVILSKYQQIDAIQFGQLMEKMGVYWAYAFGNHEARAEKEYFKYLIFKSLTDFPHCLSKFGDPDLFGYGNFIINVMNDENSVRQSLVCFDSGRDMCEPHLTNDNIPADIREMGGYDYIKPSQIKWFEDEINALKQQYGEAKSMLYMHIPIPEYKNVFNELGDEYYEPSGKAEILYGYQYESIGCSRYNSGLFDAMKRAGSQAIFVGHDHINDFAAIYDGICLVYNQCGGYNCYTLYDYKNKRYQTPEKEWPQGVTITEIEKDGSFKLRQSFHAKYL